MVLPLTYVMFVPNSRAVDTDVGMSMILYRCMHAGNSCYISPGVLHVLLYMDCIWDVLSNVNQRICERFESSVFIQPAWKTTIPYSDNLLR